MTNPKGAFTRPRLRNVLCSLFFVAAGIAVVGEIGSYAQLPNAHMSRLLLKTIAGATGIFLLWRYLHLRRAM